MMAKENNKRNDNNNMSLFLTEQDEHHASNPQEKEEKNTNTSIILAKNMNEKLCFQTIQSALQKLKITIQTIKHTNALYICPEEEWKQKVNNFMEQTDVFSFISNMTSEMSNNQVEDVLTSMNQQITNTLHNLHLCKAVITEQFEKMINNNGSPIINLNKLHFVAEIHNNEISIQPRVTYSTEEPINAIASFVNNLLEPLIDFIIHTSFTFSEASHAIKALEKYAKEGAFRSSTRFVKVNIHDLYTTLPHHLLIQALEKFLRIYVRSEQIDGIPITAVIQLVQLILDNQFYVYENKVYRQTIGGPICSSLIKGLVDIYLYHLTHNLYSKLFNENEVIGRCLNQIFFTWNESNDELTNLLNKINFLRSKHIHIKWTISFDYTMKYLSGEISNNEGILKTKVFHDTNLEREALSYVLESKTMISQDPDFLIYVALVRALVYCSNINEFQNERLNIELSFKINDTPIDVINKAVQDFLMEFHISATASGEINETD